MYSLPMNDNPPSHLISLIRQRSHSSSSQTAVRFSENHQWQSMNWQQLGAKIDSVSRSLLTDNRPVQSNIGIWSQNLPEWTMADLGILQTRCVTVPIYPTSTAEQARYIVEDAEISTLFVGEQEQFDGALKLLDSCECLNKIIVFDARTDLKDCNQAVYFSDFMASAPAESECLEKRLENQSLDDLYTLIYTSCTTGQPKGVMLDYHSIGASFESHDHLIHIDHNDVSIAFCP